MLVPLVVVGRSRVALLSRVYDIGGVSLPVRLAYKCDLVRYRSDSFWYVVSSSWMYANIRSVTTFCVRRAWIPVRIGRLVPCTVANVESAAMIVFRWNSYAFDMRSLDALPYLLLKSVVFLTLPLLEEVLLAE